MSTEEMPSLSSSAFISHLNSYPLVNDSVSYVKGHPIGQKSIALSTSAYDTLIKPFSPYIAKANGYAHPYISKVDGLADSGLGKAEVYFPIVKEPTDKIKGRITDTVYYPQRKASDVYAFGTGFATEQKDHVFKVYSDEYNKMAGDQKGLVPAAKAGITTTILLSSQFVEWFANYLSGKKQEAKEVVDEKTS